MKTLFEAINSKNWFTTQTMDAWIKWTPTGFDVVDKRMGQDSTRLYYIFDSEYFNPSFKEFEVVKEIPIPKSNIVYGVFK